MMEKVVKPEPCFESMERVQNNLDKLIKSVKQVQQKGNPQINKSNFSQTTKPSSNQSQHENNQQSQIRRCDTNQYLAHEPKNYLNITNKNNNPEMFSKNNNKLKQNFPNVNYYI